MSVGIETELTENIIFLFLITKMLKQVLSTTKLILTELIFCIFIYTQIIVISNRAIYINLKFIVLYILICYYINKLN